MAFFATILRGQDDVLGDLPHECATREVGQERGKEGGRGV